MRGGKRINWGRLIGTMRGGEVVNESVKEGVTRILRERG